LVDYELTRIEVKPRFTVSAVSLCLILIFITLLYFKKLVLHDRRIVAAIARSREGLKKHLKEKKNEEKDKDTRNIYLANEGVVRPGTANNYVRSIHGCVKF